ncbi:MAG: HNH endonuclease [Neisseria sp.]|uniref:HNH endonuclease n=1 Tax=Neisseria sicca TaxID=490 RepID=UPI000F252088|nr:MAG: HNH endonuclease [Neisseria sp.]
MLKLIIFSCFLYLLCLAIEKLYGFLKKLYRIYRKNKYFNSKDFIDRKNALIVLVNDHNEMVNYINEIRNNRSFEFGSSPTAQDIDCAISVNTSVYNYNRNRNTMTVSPNVYNCSLQIVRNASQEPIKYLIKYFGFTTDEQTLQRVESMGESISQLEEAIDNLSKREYELTQTMRPPEFIRKYYMKEFMSHMGATLSQISVPYPTYIFEYVSAGGNSSQQTIIQLNSPTIDTLIQKISERIKFRKSIEGQRALMTSGLRNEIKQRDDFTCQSCGISIYDEPHLLLEIDHIIPVSKGGMTEYSNLQTLCWKCNRSKSNKIMVVDDNTP